MSGIAGFVDFLGAVQDTEPVLQAMTSTLRRRGPDGQGLTHCGAAHIGHTRQVTSARNDVVQPLELQDETGRYRFAFDGYLTNPAQLRTALANAGATPLGDTDAELVATAYLVWGGECPGRLAGPFAMVVWDDARQTLFMARDHLGQKPLFYCKREGQVVFGSQPRALLAFPGIVPELDLAGLRQVFGLLPARQSDSGILKGIREVSPGQRVVVNRDGLTRETYWRLLPHKHIDDIATTRERVRCFINEQVAAHMDGDTTGVLLSGGLNSSLIVAMAACHLGGDAGRLHTYTLDFEDGERVPAAGDLRVEHDSAFVELLLDRYPRLNNQVLSVPPDVLLPRLGDVVAARDLTGMGDLDASYLALCDAARHDTRVVLVGDFADELFGGFPWFWREDCLDARVFPWSQTIEQRAALLSPDLAERVHLAEYVDAQYRSSMDALMPWPEDNVREAKLRRMTYLNIEWFSASLFERSDRLGADCGVDVRFPFANHEFLEYCFSIPWPMKSMGGLDKGLLRVLAEGYLPREIAHRRKNPFPRTPDPLYQTLLAARLTEIFRNPDSPVLPILNQARIEEILSGGDRGFTRPWYGLAMGRLQMLAWIVQLNDWLASLEIRLAL